MIQPWMRGVLLLGSVYNMAWAVFLYWKPNSYITWMSEGKQTSNNWVGYQSAGVAIVAVMMFLGMFKPLKFKFLIFLSFVAKLIGGLFVYLFVMESIVTKKFIFHLRNASQRDSWSLVTSSVAARPISGEIVPSTVFLAKTYNIHSQNL